jgi:hypothetical protein
MSYRVETTCVALICEKQTSEMMIRFGSGPQPVGKRKPLVLVASMSEEGEESTEQVPVDAFAIESSSGLVYPVYSNDSGFIASTRGIMDEWFKFADAAAAVNMAEHFAAIKIQSSVRQRLGRNDYSLSRHAQISLSRTYRGHRGRLEYEENVDMKFARLRREFWNSTATIVQKIFRGYYSRKNIHNFYLRKSYIETIASKGEAVRQELNEHFATMQMEAQRQQAEAHVDNFEKVVGSLHHLLSTASCRGLYNSPYHQATQATIFGLPVEEHLRNVARGTLRQTIGRTRADAASSPASSPMTAGDTHDRADGMYAFATKPTKISRAQ